MVRPGPNRSIAPNGTPHGLLTDATGASPEGRHGAMPDPGQHGGDDGYIAIIAHDVTAARADTERLRHRASHDALDRAGEPPPGLVDSRTCRRPATRSPRSHRRAVHRPRPPQVRQRRTRSCRRRPTPRIDRDPTRRHGSAERSGRADRWRRVPRRVPRRSRHRDGARTRRSHPPRTHRSAPSSANSTSRSRSASASRSPIATPWGYLTKRRHRR